MRHPAGNPPAPAGPRLWRCLALLLLGLTLSGAPRASILELSDATATVTVDGSTKRGSVTLPYNWDRENTGRQGQATIEIPFALGQLPDRQYGIFFSRLGTAYEVWLNDALVAQKGDLSSFNGDDYGQIQRFLVVPANLLRHDNRFVIRIKADRSRRAGVPRVIIGPQEEVEPVYLGEVRLYVVGTLVVTILSLLVGTISLSLWFTQGRTLPGRGRQRDHLYLFAGLAEFIWALRIGSVLIEQPPLPWEWWGPLIALSMGAWTVCMTIFCFSVAGWTTKAWARWAYWMFGIFLLTGLPASIWGWEYRWAMTAWYAVNNTLVIPFAIAFVWSAFRKASRTHIIVAGAAMLNVLVGVRDWVVLRASDSFGETALIRYSSVVFGLSLGYIVVMRFRDATTQARDLMDTMADRVAQKEAELKASYEQVEQLARAQERLAERSRILRDMHDGVGSHISSAIRQLQSGRASNEDLLLTLRDSLDQLKLSIDAMNLPPGDITALLANMRYRLGPRFSASDIELQWAVSQLPIRAGLDMQGTRHLQFMLFEALSNVLQHARATILRIESEHSGETGHTVLRVIDNGCGFDVSTQPLRSLASIRERAAAIGARIDVSSRPGHTELAIWL